MKKAILLFASIFLAILSNAQAPSLSWAKSFTATTKLSVYYGKSMAVDAAGNSYITGDFAGTIDFDPGPATYYLTADSMVDNLYVCKIDPSGNFLWAVHTRGTGFSLGQGIALDASGNAYVVGYFSGTTDFDPGPASDSLNSSGGGSTVVLKLDASGNHVWAKKLGSSGSSDFIQGLSIGLDGLGNIWTAGTLYGTADFDPGPSVVNLSTTGSSGDAFVCKLDPLGNYSWAGKMGGVTSADNGQGYSISVAPSGNVYIAGSFYGTLDFDPGAGVFSMSSATTETYVMKLNASGNFVWGKLISCSGSSDFCMAYCITTDAAENVHTTGPFRGTIDLDPGAGLANHTSVLDDVYVSKLDAAGNFIWGKTLGPSSSTNVDGFSVALDVTGNVYVCGSLLGTADFDPGSSSDSLSSLSGNSDIFVMKLDAAGNYKWAVNMGGSSGTYYASGNTLALDAAKNIYTTGFYQGTVDFDPGAGIVTFPSSLPTNIFLQKLSQGTDGMNENASSDNLTIYPNPGNGLFHLVIEDAEKEHSIELFNCVGQRVMSLDIGTRTMIDVRDQPKGIYFVKVSSVKGVTGIKKLIKQ